MPARYEAEADVISANIHIPSCYYADGYARNGERDPVEYVPPCPFSFASSSSLRTLISNQRYGDVSIKQRSFLDLDISWRHLSID